MILKELLVLREQRKNLHDQGVEFVQGWADSNLRDFDSIDDAFDKFWSDVRADTDRYAELRRLKLSKDTVFDILSNVADNMGLDL